MEKWATGQQQAPVLWKYKKKIQFESNLFSLMRLYSPPHVRAQFLLPLKRFPLHPQQEFCSGGWAARPKDCVWALTSVEARSWMHIHAFLNGWCEGLLLNCHHLGGKDKKKKKTHATPPEHIFICCTGFSSRTRGIYTLVTALKNMVSQKQGSLVPSH